MRDTPDEINKVTEEYYNEIYKFCLNRVVRAEDAYDVAHEVFVAMIKRYSKINPNNIRMWLYVTARHKLADYYKEIKQTRANVTFIPDIESIDEVSYKPFDEISEAEIEEIKCIVLSYLSEKERELYVDRFKNLLDYHEIAERYNITEDAARKRVSRLKEKIKKLLGPYLGAFFLSLFE